MWKVILRAWVATVQPARSTCSRNFTMLQPRSSALSMSHRPSCINWKAGRLNRRIASFCGCHFPAAGSVSRSIGRPRKWLLGGADDDSCGSRPVFNSPKVFSALRRTRYRPNSVPTSNASLVRLVMNQKWRGSVSRSIGRPRKRTPEGLLGLSRWIPGGPPVDTGRPPRCNRERPWADPAQSRGAHARVNRAGVRADRTAGRARRQ